MTDASDLVIVLCTDDPERRISWLRLLAAAGDVVAPGESLYREVLALAPGILLVLDGTSEPPRDTTLASEWPEAGRLAVIQIGPGRETSTLPPPEVVLPPDAAPREVALACELVGRILQLRMEKRHATAARQRLHDLAHRDPLTGVLNRRGWEAALARQVAATATEAGTCIAMIDLDHFKRINDQFGHAAGDTVLTRAAEILAAELRPVDIVARLGGDEFAVLIAEVDRAAAAAVVQRLLQAMRDRLANVVPLPVTVSIGYRPTDATQCRGSNPAACMKSVDDALHEAKRQGRDRAVSA